MESSPQSPSPPPAMWIFTGRSISTTNVNAVFPEGLRNKQQPAFDENPFSKGTAKNKPANSTLLSEQTSTSH
jgi:hypothetical protein